MFHRKSYETTARRQWVRTNFCNSLDAAAVAERVPHKHRRTDQLYAVKLIRSDLPRTDKQLQLFVREAGVLTQLEHPRIVKAIDSDRGTYS